MKRPPPATSSVVSLNTHPCQPHPERIECIKRWHIEQATSVKAVSVATLNISITTDGEIRTATLAIEPEHAVVILSELHRVTTLLHDFIGSSGKLKPKTKPNIIRLIRSA